MQIPYSPDVFLNQLMLFIGFAVIFMVVISLLIEYDVIKLPKSLGKGQSGKNRFTKTVMLLCIFFFYLAMIIGVAYAVQAGIMSIPDLDPLTMKSAFDALSLMVFIALLVPIALMVLLRNVVKHK